MFKTISADQLRSMYFSFFKERGHAIIPSASLIPENDPSVLFTTAGMHPLVPYLLGQPHPSGERLVNCQKCMRTSDIEEVGDNAHLTFFEMLGNWSLGDYFKDESIVWSFEFLTSPDYLNIPVDKIWVTVFAGSAEVERDDYSAGVWHSLGIPSEHILFLSAEHNWWAVGDEGPCGPDTEIFVDSTGQPCTNGKECFPGLCDCGRFFEIWNNVFMTFQRTGGKLIKLQKQNVDTGMGLERTLAILNGYESVYDISCLKPTLDRLANHSNKSRQEIESSEKLTRTLRVLTDHLRSSVFLLGDERGIKPSNQGQGYVLRRLIRRSIRFCELLGIAPTSWTSTAETVIDIYGDIYPELRANAKRIRNELMLEQDRFEKTLDKGTKLLEKEVERLQSEGSKTISGEVAFKLYDTYGFPIEFTQEIAGERGLSVDIEEYEECFARHREKSRTEAAKSGLADLSEESVRYHTATHLLHAALRHVLGDHVQQKGSNITKDRLRFDFSHPQPMTKEQIAQVEAFVKKAIDAAIPVVRTIMPYERAKELGAIGLFENRYENDVSVYKIGAVSFELCGGPHVSNTKEIGAFKIMKEQSSSAGVRRIRAVISLKDPEDNSVSELAFDRTAP